MLCRYQITFGACFLFSFSLVAAAPIHYWTDDDVRPRCSEMTMTSLVWGVGAEMTDEANPRTKQAVALDKGSCELGRVVGLDSGILSVSVVSALSA